MTEEEEGLVKIFIDLPNHWATDSEAIWAKPLENDEFEVRNSPFSAYGINWGDIVKAVSPQPYLKPQVVAVVKASGNRTLRVIFNQELDRDAQDTYLFSLNDLGVSFERANNVLVALDIRPDADYQAVCSRASELEQDGIWEYETCEQRVDGSFGDVPSEDGVEVSDEIH